MTPLQKHYDKVARSSVSETGYVGMVKRRLGWRVRDEKRRMEEERELENVSPGTRRMEEEVRRENGRRRRESEREERELGVEEVLAKDAVRKDKKNASKASVRNAKMETKAEPS